MRTPWKRGSVPGATGSVLVSLTDFEVGRFRDLPRVVLAGIRLRLTWRTREGSLGLTLWIDPLRRRLGSLSAWRSEEDLRRFLSSPEHVAVVRRLRGRMWNVASVSWTAEGFAPREAWAEGRRRRSAV